MIGALDLNFRCDANNRVSHSSERGYRSQEETTRAEPTIPVKDKLNHMVEEEVNLAAVDAGCAGNLNEDLDNVTSGVDM